MTKNLILRITCFLGLAVLGFLILLNPWLYEDFFYKANKNSRLTLASPLNEISEVSGLKLKETTIDDASQLSETKVAAVFQPKSLAEIQQLIKLAKKSKRKISISGSRHSLGGQNLFPDSIHLNLNNFNKVIYQQEDQSVTCYSGATWKDVQEKLGKYKRAVAVMQDSNIFTLGGSLSLNVHGKDPRFGSLIKSVNWFKILLANGQEITCSREENPALFKAAVGGMGLLGIITEINLKTVPNEIYHSNFVNIPAKSLVETMDSLAAKKHTELLEAQMSVDNSNLLNEAQVYYYQKANSSKIPQDNLSGENNIWLRRFVYRVSRSNNLGKLFRWFVQKQIGRFLEFNLLTRNTAMSAPVRMLQLNDKQSTDILQEYFVPEEKVSAFLQIYKQLLLKHQIKVVNVTVRKVKKDKEALASYAVSDMYAFVAYYTISKQASSEKQMREFTKELADFLIQLKGNFYLAYKNYATKEQTLKMYPSLNELFALKRKYDPSFLYMNSWYQELATGD